MTSKETESSEDPSLQSSSTLKEDDELYFITSWPPCDEIPLIQGDDPASSCCQDFDHDPKQCSSEDNLVNDAQNSIMRLQNKTVYETGTKEAKCFLKEKILELKNRLEKCSSVARTACYVALASCYEALEEYDIAEMFLKKAIISSSQKCNDILWLLAKVRRQLNMKQQQEVLARQLKLEQSLKLRKPIYVERRSLANLTVEEFREKYTKTRTPVVIENVVKKMVHDMWDLNFICKVAGKKRVTLRKLVPNSIEWARLKADLDMTVEEFINSVVNNESENRYLFDWSLPLHCPELADQLVVPDYFKEDFLKQTTPGSLYRDSWPSLFVAPAGITSELHVDAFGSNFWMALFVGQKRWTFFQEEDTAKLYPRFFHSLDPAFDVDLSDPRLDEFPLLGLAQPIECILQPGELLFVPASCPHRVENLETSVAVSSNFVDESNISLARTELEINSLIDARAKDVLAQFELNGWI
ncbi:bifunctional arginine demethylase and lysyl-hydroxylase JMJD6-A-like isoform X2 [Tachypleus tridentatus]|uniref:bifunctional arginine demethylase and lysyl-hydroxylase JMJD6-A-like isoform X2 n=1 Tax=Tachypleus tridentatus TaxID=6853 RepID=UPI003FD54E08